MKIAIHGINGKMGREIAQSILKDNACSLTGASVRPEHPWSGKKLADVLPVSSNLKITSNLEVLCQNADVVIDFTRPDATLALLPICQRYNCAVMIGTTGFTDSTKKWIESMAEHLPIVLAANTSLGVNILEEISSQVAQVLSTKQWDIEILEKHHRRKEDAPSGTALRLGESIAKAQHSDLAERMVYPYVEKRETGDIGFSVIRGGDIVGEHTVYFINENEELALTHKAQNRSIFAEGAVIAAKWLSNKVPGLYGMSDVLGFSKK